MPRAQVTRTQTARSAVARRPRGGQVVRLPEVLGVPMIVHHCDGTTLYGSPAGSSGGYGNRLYTSTDGQAWTLRYTFPARSQPTSLTDVIQTAFVLPTGTLIVATCNDNWDSYGALWRSTDGGDSFSLVHEFVQETCGGCYSWNLDGNADYAVAGSYGNRSTTGVYDRTVYLSDDDGLTWARCFHIEGDGSTDAKNTHVHMARIDPEGGCWISVGDHVTDWTASGTLGLWHSPGKPTTFSDPGAHNYGSFTRVYSHTSEYARIGSYPRVRPVTILFSDGYAYLGEDDMTSAEARTITRLKYSDASYTPEILVDNTEAVSSPAPYYNGPVFGMAKLTDDIWVAVVPGGVGTSPGPTSAYMLITYDRGQTWRREPTVHGSLKSLCRTVHVSTGAVYGGRPYDPYGFGYKLAPVRTPT